MPIEPDQLRKLRKSLGLTQEDAGKTVLVNRRTWQNWEIDKGKENHRAMTEGLLELFCIKHKIKYRLLDNKVHIEYI
ncbi:MAG: transcriptional regulator [Alteromonadaceae bacterium]|jgi:DNA-binding transcriptional regulator YiaG|uniref:helix-turn-helix domain-containing protein n=1 Tax=unclassified Methylophaga TaxID=2629249 RepID=UPI000C6C2F98|nr:MULTISPECIES: helix-turn-helix transcriptional regulator [unclassified Methylophaga]MAP28087.1 transcriptional regulator [Methylophaga sp.]MBN26777.1 transcriptional regulator [Alteromonadaceae bacterium]HCN99723.1 transcriptional regulator [Methylophaga sp.]|tara:strand:- start:13125 stop:13355 length:231 start_codon:yes stop_codon:yes gene_type:complete